MKYFKLFTFFFLTYFFSFLEKCKIIFYKTEAEQFYCCMQLMVIFMSESNLSIVNNLKEKVGLRNRSSETKTLLQWVASKNVDLIVILLQSTTNRLVLLFVGRPLLSSLFCTWQHLLLLRGHADTALCPPRTERQTEIPLIIQSQHKQNKT